MGKPGSFQSSPVNLSRILRELRKSARDPVERGGQTKSKTESSRRRRSTMPTITHDADAPVTDSPSALFSFRSSLFFSVPFLLFFSLPSSSSARVRRVRTDWEDNGASSGDRAVVISSPALASDGRRLTSGTSCRYCRNSQGRGRSKGRSAFYDLAGISRNLNETQYGPSQHQSTRAKSHLRDRFRNVYATSSDEQVFRQSLETMALSHWLGREWADTIRNVIQNW